MYKLGFKEEEEPEIKLPTFIGSWRKQESLPDHLTCLLRKLSVVQEAIVRTLYGKIYWLKVGKGVRQSFILPPCLFNFYTEYIMKNVGMDESQAGIKTARINTDNLRYADNTTLMAETEEELKSLLKRGKQESENTGLKFNIQKIKIMASSSIISWKIEEGKWKHCQWVPKSPQRVTSAIKLKGTCSLEGKL